MMHHLQPSSLPIWPLSTLTTKRMGTRATPFATQWIQDPSALLKPWPSGSMGSAPWRQMSSPSLASMHPTNTSPQWPLSTLSAWPLAGLVLAHSCALQWIGAHSLHVSEAMALKLNGFDELTIMKLGYWTSNTFMSYLHA